MLMILKQGKYKLAKNNVLIAKTMRKLNKILKEI